MNNNIDHANFDKMLELAEFGAKRHNERRQKLFQSYYCVYNAACSGSIPNYQETKTN